MKRVSWFIWGLICGVWAMFVLTLAFFNYFPGGPQLIGSQQIDLHPLVQELKQQISNLWGSGNALTQAKERAIFDLLTTQYIYQDKIDAQKMQEYALKGYVDALGDPYTSYMTVDENKMFDEELEGEMEFEGIGAVVVKKEQGVLIEEVLKNSPAFKAGIEPLDLIIQIDGEDIHSLTLPESVKKMRGPKGSKVEFTIFRERADKVMRIEAIRDTIVVPSVRGEIMDRSGSQQLYIEVAVFGDDTKRSFKAVMDELASSAQGVILDLRGNGGWYLPMASELASFFLPKETVVTETRYLSYPTETFTSKGYAYLQGKPLVVLVDDITASASEIVAAALRERGNAKLVWEKTFGKWSIQTLHELPDGSLLKYTVGKRYTPNGNHIEDHEGLVPDVEVVFDAESYLSGGVDNQLITAQATLQSLILSKQN